MITFVNSTVGKANEGVIFEVREEAPTCNVVLDACRKAVDEQEKTLSLKDYGIQIRQEEVVRLQTENMKLREADTSILRNPFAWAALGVILGAYAGARVVR